MCFIIILKVLIFYKTSTPKLMTLQFDSCILLYTQICYILSHKRTHCHMLCFHFDKTGSFVRGFFFFITLVTHVIQSQIEYVRPAYQFFCCQKPQYSRKRVSDHSARECICAIVVCVFFLYQKSIIMGLARHVTKTRSAHFIFYLRYKNILFFSDMLQVFFLKLLMCFMKHNILIYLVVCVTQCLSCIVFEIETFIK